MRWDATDRAAVKFMRRFHSRLNWERQAHRARTAYAWRRGGLTFIAIADRLGVTVAVAMEMVRSVLTIDHGPAEVEALMRHWEIGDRFTAGRILQETIARERRQREDSFAGLGLA